MTKNERYFKQEIGDDLYEKLMEIARDDVIVHRSMDMVFSSPIKPDKNYVLVMIIDMLAKSNKAILKTHIDSINIGNCNICNSCLERLNKEAES